MRISSLFSTLFLILALSMTGAAQGRTNFTKTFDQVENSNDSILKTFSSVLFQANVPAGISALEDDSTQVELNKGTCSIEEMLNKIVRADDRYNWKTVDGVINVFPSKDYSILDINIAEFKIENALSPQLRKALLQSSELKRYFAVNNLINESETEDQKNSERLMFGGGLGVLSQDNYVTMDLKNVTVRQILNEIVRQKGFGTWFYREFDVNTGSKITKTFRLVV